MSTFYYQNNELLGEPWRTPEGGGGRPWLWAAGAALLGALLFGLLWWGPQAREARIDQAAVLIRLVRHSARQVTTVEVAGVVIDPAGVILTRRGGLSEGGKPITGEIEVWVDPGSERRQVLKAEILAQGQGPFKSVEALATDWVILRVEPEAPLAWADLSQPGSLAEGEAAKVRAFPFRWDPAAAPYGPKIESVNGALSGLTRGQGGGLLAFSHDARGHEWVGGGPLSVGGRVVGLNFQSVGGEGEEQAVAVEALLPAIRPYLPGAQEG